jgi:hypothetical protein
MNCRRNRSPWSSFCEQCRLRAIIGTLALSGSMNALSFKAGSRNPGVYVFTRAGAMLYIQRS